MDKRIQHLSLFFELCFPDTIICIQFLYLRVTQNDLLLLEAHVTSCYQIVIPDIHDQFLFCEWHFKMNGFESSKLICACVG